MSPGLGQSFDSRVCTITRLRRDGCTCGSRGVREGCNPANPETSGGQPSDWAVGGPRRAVGSDAGAARCALGL
jgi:hypothetical protein